MIHTTLLTRKDERVNAAADHDENSHQQTQWLYG